jgi:hypothetical protein
MKKFICGLITGLLIAMPLVGFAATKNIKKAIFNNDTSITIDGKPSSMQLVAVTLEGDQNGSNYGPIRGIAEAMGGKIEYDPKAKNIDIKTPTTIEPTTKEDNDVSDITEKPKSTPDGITQIDEYQGKYYIGFIYIKNKCNEKGYDFSYDIKLKHWSLKKGENVLMENIETTFLAAEYGYDACEYNYYINTIMPLLK